MGVPELLNAYFKHVYTLAELLPESLSRERAPAPRREHHQRAASSSSGSSITTENEHDTETEGEGDDGDDERVRHLLQMALIASDVPLEHLGWLCKPDPNKSDSMEPMAMGDVIETAQLHIFRQHARAPDQRVNWFPSRVKYYKNAPPNTLTMGCVLVNCTDNVGGVVLGHGPGADPNAIRRDKDNSIIAYLNGSPIWDALLAKIGPQAMIKLLSHPTSALFMPLQNSNYMQLTGPPLAEMTLPSREAFARSRQVEEVPASKKPKRRRRGKKRSRACDEGVTSPTSMNIDSLESTQPEEPALPDAPPPSKRRRLGPATTAPPDLLAPAVAQPQPLRTAASALAISPLKRGGSATMGHEAPRKRPTTVLRPNDVRIARSRIFYASILREPSGKPVVGLSAHHMLSRLAREQRQRRQTEHEHPAVQIAARHALKYIFPRAWRLASAFEPSPDAPNSSKQHILSNAQRLDEIKRAGSMKTPARLKTSLGMAARLVVLAHRCRYDRILNGNCPARTSKPELNAEDSSYIASLTAAAPTNAGIVTQATPRSLEYSHASQIVATGADAAAARAAASPAMLEFACPPHRVAAFLISVTKAVIPQDFWGSQRNQRIVLSRITEFVHCRRFETLSVHTLIQGFSTADCDWLAPRSATRESNKHQKRNESDMKVRRDLVSDLIFWFFDGFIIDLIRANFYVTESQGAGKRTLFFRHRDWLRLAKPTIDRLTSTVFERIPQNELAQYHGRERQLAYSFMRLLPKEFGARPIVNLNRRVPRLLRAGTASESKGDLMWGINVILRNVFQILNWYKESDETGALGASVLGPNEIYTKIKLYKQQLWRRQEECEEARWRARRKLKGLSGRDQAQKQQKTFTGLPKLYFVKADVTACFDTIKQDKLLEMLEALLDEDFFRVTRYATVAPNRTGAERKWLRQAMPSTASDGWDFFLHARELAEKRENTIFSDQLYVQDESRYALLRLLREHVSANVVKIGNAFYRQKEGIPQGSVLSALLCSIFYGDLERNELDFTREDDSLLMRYVDDFLFITTSKAKAVKFVQAMHHGYPEYGCKISTEKCLANFDISVDGVTSVRSTVAKSLTWCGHRISMDHLNVSCAFSTGQKTSISDALTLEKNKHPGNAFVSKMMRMIKIRQKAMYNDATLNPTSQILVNLYHTCLISATRMTAYVRSWRKGAGSRRNDIFLQKCIVKLVNYAYTSMQKSTETALAREHGAQCQVKKDVAMWLGKHAFQRVLRQCSGAHGHLISWLAGELSCKNRHHRPGRSSVAYEKEYAKIIQRAVERVACD